MVRGLYTAASGAVVAQSNVDVISNNLANVNTSGFKRTLMQVEAAPNIELHGDELSQADESALYHHFELNYTPIETESGRRLARR